MKKRSSTYILVIILESSFVFSYLKDIFSQDFFFVCSVAIIVISLPSDYKTSTSIVYKNSNESENKKLHFSNQAKPIINILMLVPVLDEWVF